MSEVGFTGLLAKVHRVMNASEEEREALRLVAIALYAPSGDAQGERAHGDGTAAQGSSQGDTGGEAMTEQYAAGGYVPGGETWTALDPDECLIRPPFDLPAVCTRISHPTPTSDCTVKDWIRHVGEGKR